MTIDFSEIAPSYTPRTDVELDRTGGVSGLARDVKRLLLVGYKTSSGSKAAGVVERITSRAKAMEYWGEGSTVAIMAEAALSIAPLSPLYGVCFAEGTGTNSAGTVTFATTATAAGTCKVTIGGKVFQFGIAKDDTPTVMGDALVAQIAQVKNLPFTAANVTGAVTITARNKGPTSNTILTQAEITAGIGTTVAVVQLTGASTDGDPTSVLTGVEGDRYHLICLGTGDATTGGKLADHCEKQSAAGAQKWCIGIIGSVDTRSNAGTIATTIDSYNVQVAWQQACNIPVYEMAARFAAVRSTKAANVGVINTVIPGVIPTVDETKWPTAADIEAAIEGGLTPIAPLRNGNCECVRSVITRQTAPISYRDHNYEEIWHYTAENIIDRFKSRVQGKRLKSASPPGLPTTITPDRATALLNGVLFSLDKLDYLQGVKTSIEAGNNFCEVNAIEPTSRIDGAFDYIPVGIVIQTALKGTYKRPFSFSL